ncbi:hypothetical protein A5886_001433 [Enterococcus sp. 8G7_MSG3316]|uniref:Uncharacterized protein n=1 Tax=Candidatus Enterococcus testudinis TaxID=1834191 RepID=A0A242A5P4_9ENTE|nr:hypothetical protein A5886_001433 [Enterococcus sp. 8G7_MSG3316]
MTVEKEVEFLEGKIWKISGCNLFLQIGDARSEIELVPNIFDMKLKSTSLKSPLLFEKDRTNSFYFSKKLDMVIEDKRQYHSSIGGIYYFPTWKCLGINLDDEEFTLDVPRYNLGKIKGNLYQIQTLQVKEQAKLYWEYTLKPEK